MIALLYFRKYFKLIIYTITKNKENQSFYHSIKSLTLIIYHNITSNSFNVLAKFLN